MLSDLCDELLNYFGSDPQQERLTAIVACWVWTNTHCIESVHNHLELMKCWQVLRRVNEGNTNPNIAAILESINSNLSRNRIFVLGDACVSWDAWVSRYKWYYDYSQSY